MRTCRQLRGGDRCYAWIGKAGARSLAELAMERGSGEQTKQELLITATKLHEPYPRKLPRQVDS